MKVQNSISFLIREQVLFIARPPPGGGSVVLRISVCCGAFGAVGSLRPRTVRHRLLHRLAGAQPRAVVPVLYHLPFLLLLRAALRHHHPVLHLHPDDGARVTPGHPAARVTTDKDRQRPCSHCQGELERFRHVHLFIVSIHHLDSLTGLHCPSITSAFIISCNFTLYLTHYLINTTLIFFSPQLSVAVCIGFLGAWSPYAIVAMWASFGNATWVPPDAFAVAAILAKSSTIYNPVVYLLCKPNFRECLYKDTSTLRQRIYRGSPQSDPRERFGGASQRHKDLSISTRLSNGQQDSYGTCPHCAEEAELGHVTSQRTACILTGSTFTEVTVGQPSAAPADLL